MLRATGHCNTSEIKTSVVLFAAIINSNKWFQPHKKLAL